MGSPAAGWRALSCLSADFVAAAPASFAHKACFGSPEQLRLLGGTGILRWLEQAAQMGHSFPRSTTNKAEREGRGSLMRAVWAWTALMGPLLSPDHPMENRSPLCALDLSVSKGKGAEIPLQKGKAEVPQWHGRGCAPGKKKGAPASRWCSEWF